MSEKGRGLSDVSRNSRALGNVDIENLLEFLKCHHEFLRDDMFTFDHECYASDRVALFFRCTLTRSRQLAVFVVVGTTALSRIIRRHTFNKR